MNWLYWAREGEFGRFDDAYHGCSPTLMDVLEDVLAKNQGEFVIIEQVKASSTQPPFNLALNATALARRGSTPNRYADGKSEHELLEKSVIGFLCEFKSRHRVWSVSDLRGDLSSFRKPGRAARELARASRSRLACGGLFGLCWCQIPASRGPRSLVSGRSLGVQREPFMRSLLPAFGRMVFRGAAGRLAQRAGARGHHRHSLGRGSCGTCEHDGDDSISASGAGRNLRQMRRLVAMKALGSNSSPPGCRRVSFLPRSRGCGWGH